MTPSRILCALALALPAVAWAGDFKAAYVNLQRAAAEVDDGKAALKKLEKAAAEKKKKLEGLGAALKADKEALDKQAATMAEDVKKKKGEELQTRYLELMKLSEDSQRELSEEERKLLAPIIGRLQSQLAQIATREGLTMVFEQGGSGVAWALPSLDLTNELIRAYNNQPKGKAPAAPAANATP